MRLFRSTLLIFLTYLLISLNLSSIYAISGQETASENLLEYSDGMGERLEYLVSYKENFSYSEFMKGMGGLLSTDIEASSQSYTTLFLTEEEKQILLSDPQIAYVEPNATVSLLQEGVPTKDGDSYIYRNFSGETTSWGVTAIGGDIAHQAGIKGEDVKIAILDTGISPHSDLHVSGGISVIDSVYSYNDDNGHGTHIAGIVGAKLNNTGIVGVAPEAEIYAVKVLDQFGNGKYSNVISGIDWAIENQMDIISMSFGGHQPSQIFHQAIQRAADAGIIVVASVGNEGIGENTILYPALFPEVLSVGAVDKSFVRSVFSSTGEELDLVAPGNVILSTTRDGDYGISTGTSVSTPFVVGAAALIWSQNRDWTSEEVKTNLFLNATDLGQLSYFGHGIVNVAKSLALSSVPIPPFSIDNAEDEYTWQPPVGNSGEGDVSISAYDKVGDQQTIDQGQSATVSLRLDETKSYVYIGVFNSADDKIGGTTYYNQQAGVPISYTWNTSELTTPGTYRIKYAYSGTTTVNWFTVYVVSPPTPGNIPSAPSDIYYTATSETIKVNWSPSSGATSYRLRMNGNVVSTQNYTYTYFNLQPNTYYPIEVAAVNNYGSSNYVAISPTPKTEPFIVNAPTGLYVSSFNHNSITITWDNMGSGFQYEIKLNGSVIGTTSNRTYTFSNLQTNQIYTLGVATKHSSGSMSSLSTIQKRTLFPIPTGLSSSNVTEDSLVLSWNAINGARFSIQKDGQYLDSTNLNSYTVTNLLPNRTYSFSVASKNGDGELSALSSVHTKITLADNVKPTINNFSISGSAPYYTENYVDFSIFSYDKYGIASQKFIVRRDNFGPLEYTVSPAATQYSFFAPTEGSYLFTLEVQDTSGNTATKTIGPINFVKKKDIVIYVPGFMNSEIKENGRVEWPTMRLPLSYNPLALNTNGTPKYNTSVGEVFERLHFDLWPLPPIDVDYGEKFLNKLRNRNVEVVKVAYDWRTDLRQAAARLQQTVNNVSAQYPGQKVTIITHSMGGMVARYYLLTDQSAQQKVKTFINVVAPNLGTVRSIQGLVAGDDLDAISLGYYPFSIYEAHNMVQNFSSVYQLIPGKKFVDAYDRVYTANFKSYFKFNDLLKPKNNVDTYTGTKSYINNNHNSILYEDPESPNSFRYVIENRTLPSSIKEYRIVGTRGSTIIKLIREVPNIKVDAVNRSERFMAIWGIGDNVVPLISAEFDRIGNSTNYYVDQTHVGILSPYTDTNVSPMFEIVKSIVLDNSPLTPSSYPRPSVSSVIGTALDIRCPVNVLITDQFGNTAFVNEQGFVENQIEGVAYEIVGESKLIFVEQGVNVDFEITGYDEGDMSVGITKYENDGPVTVNVLNDISIKDVTKINFAITGGQTNTALTDINYDYNGDGNIQVLHATDVLTPNEYLDGTAPTSSHQLTGEEGFNNYYRTPVIVSLQASDGDESGGEQIYYTINDGTSVKYTAPFEIAINGIHILKYFAIDKTGNREEENVIEFTIDTEAPSQPANLYVSERTESSITFSWSAATDNISNVQYEIYRDANLIDTIDGLSYTFNNLSLGTDVLFKVVAIDEAGNKSIASEEVKSSVLDLISPITNHEIEGTITNGWYTADITLTLDATDGLGSGINQIFYKIDNLPVEEYTTPLVLREEGLHIIKYYSVDIAGNVEEEKKFEYKLDKTVPSSPTNLHVSDRTESSIEFSWDHSIDNLGEVSYEVYQDGGLVDTILAASYTVSNLELGTSFTFKVIAVDEALNRSSQSEEIIALVQDTNAPTTDRSIEGNSVNGWYNTDVVVILNSSDGIGSGVDKTFYSINGGALIEYDIPITFNQDGVFELKYFSFDVVGNVEEDKIFEIKLDKEEPSTPIIDIKRDLASWVGITTTTTEQRTGTVILSEGNDSGSGLANLQYRIGDSGNWDNYSGPFNIDLGNSSSLNIYARAIDNAGNSSNSFKSTVGKYKISPYNGHQIYLLGIGGSIVLRSGSTYNDGYDFKYVGGVSYSEVDQTLSLNYTEYVERLNEYRSGTVKFLQSYFQSVDTQWDNEPPTIPTDLSIGSRTQSAIQIKWKSSSDNINVTGYDIYMGGTRIGSSSETEYTVNNLSVNKEYNFTIKAKDAAGNVSKASESLRYLTFEDSLPPTIPTQLIVVGTSDSSVTLTWKVSTDNIAIQEYEIFNGTEQVGSSKGNTYTITNLKPNSEYQLSVRAKDFADNVSISSETINIVTSRDHTPPSEPSNLNIIERTETTASLTWTASTDNVEVASYDVYQNGVKIGSTSSTSHDVNGLAFNHLYSFTLIALDAEGNQSGSSVAVETRYFESVQSVNVVPASRTLIISWEAITGASSYDIEVNGEVTNSLGTITSFTKMDLSPNTEYLVRVRANSVTEDGAWSTQFSSKTLYETPIISTASTINSITLNWNTITGATGYELEIDSVLKSNITGNTFIHSGLAANTAHKYRIRAKSSTNESSWSAFVIKSTLSAPVPVITLTSTSSSNFVVSWTAIPGATGYDVEVDGVNVSLSGTTLTYTKTGLGANTNHSARVRAKSTAGLGDWSPYYYGKTQLSIPVVIVEQITRNSIQLIWSAIAGASEYEVIADGVVYNGYISPAEPRFYHTGLQPGTSHTYKVRAKSSSNTSAWSTVLTKATKP